VKDCAVKKDANAAAILPNAATVRDGSYPITRFLYLYTHNRPAGEVKQFVDWVLAPEGQQLATKVGYFPIH